MLKGKPIKISVIGVGHVGSVVGFILARGGLANEIVLCGRDEHDEKAKDSQRRAAMAALDIKHAICFTSHRLEVRAGISEDTRDSDILVGPGPLQWAENPRLLVFAMVGGLLVSQASDALHRTGCMSHS
jgi:hypothetical protein